MKIDVWIVFGIFAQLMFSARFLVQWVVSEIKKQSTVPKIFWYLSLGGSILLLIYSIHRKDPVFILGQSIGSIIYIRNIMLFKDEV